MPPTVVVTEKLPGVPTLNVVAVALVKRSALEPPGDPIVTPPPNDGSKAKYCAHQAWVMPVQMRTSGEPGPGR